MRNLFRLAQVLLLALVCQHSFATPQELLAQLQQIRLSSTNAITNFYMFSGLDADRKYQRLIEQSTKKTKAALIDAQALAKNNNMDSDVAAIQKSWQDLEKLLTANTNDILKQGFPDVRLVDEMRRINADLVTQVDNAYLKLQDTSGIKPNAAIAKARNLAVLMEKITTQYAIRGTTNLGHVFAGGSDSNIAELADEFQKGLDELSIQVKASKTDILMENIRSKWGFIADRVRNYNENTVPFLVVSYNDRIVEHLHELESLIQ